MRSVNIAVGLPQMDPDLRKEWTTWLERHHIDPNEVLLGHDITCDDENRRIEWTSLVRDENGKVVTCDREAAKQRCYVQLESPALPMPPVPGLDGRPLPSPWWE